MLTRKQIDEFDRTVTKRLRALADRIRLYVLADGLAIVLLVTVGFVLAQLLIDRLLRLTRDMRAALLAVGVALVAYVAWRWIISPLRRAVTSDAAALLVERTFPQLSDRLISAVQFTRPAARAEHARVAAGARASGAMMSVVVDQARAAVEGLAFEDALDHGRARRQSALGGACVMGFALACLLMPGQMGVWFQRNVLLTNVEWPQRTHLRVEGLADGRLIAPAGDDLQINVTAVDHVPRSVQLEYGPGLDVTDPSAVKRGEVSMVKVGERRFRAVFPQIRNEMRARAIGGDAVTEWFDVVLVERPRVLTAQLDIVPPAYAGQPRQALREGQTVAEVLRGSEVTIRAQTNKPVVRAELFRGDSAIEEVPVADTGDRVTATFTPAESGTYHFRLTDAERLSNRRPVHFSLRVVSDRPPRVTMRIPGLGDMVTPDATLPISIEMSDTYGLATAELVYRIAGAGEAATQPTTLPVATAPSGETVEPLADFEPGGTSFTTSLNWSLTQLRLKPGQRLTLVTRAADFDDVAGPNVGESATFLLRVVPPDELLAELSRREQEYRQAFERLIRDQETLRGQVLSSISRLRTDADAGRKGFAPHERRQHDLARRVMGIHEQFQRILGEMEINHVVTRPLRLRLANRIIQPLEGLGRKQMTGAGDRLGAVARTESDADLSRIDPDQAAVVDTMRGILAHMLQWEGFHEAVAILRDIIKGQGDLNEETEAELERRVQKLFGDKP